MSYTYVKNIGRPGATYNLLEPITHKVIATTTADAKGNVVIASVPPGQYKEQIIFTTPGDASPTTQTSINPIDFQTANGTPGLFLQSPDGHLWQLQAANTTGAISATQIA